ncbi:hypothetical protein EXM22_02825 [Oceanispirochaeta crateris]|uniref:Acyltransferase 3 domain-containing protein n=1 Tax=Oceanispirochaeta crateris TaxID=2518645 RepID=A0A5C1QHC7_9SPIO|nr:hypothetical protein EXM22_02825 [Oceanispirochaeta crateris]
MPYALAVIIFLVFQSLLGNSLKTKNIIKYFFLILLPQGSYWYLVLLFYWYIMFFFIAGKVDNLKFSIPVMIVISIVIIILKDFNRNFVWQFATFPLGMIAGAYPKQIKTRFSKIQGLRPAINMLLLSLILIAVKKTPFVDSRGLGVIDTILQILITWIVSSVFVINVNLWEKLRILKSVLLFVGSWSYSLYLSHVLPLDYLKNNMGSSSNVFTSILIYTSTVFISVTVIKIFEVVLGKCIYKISLLDSLNQN